MNKLQSGEWSVLTEQAWALIRVTQTSGPRMWSAALQRTVTEDGQELNRTSVQASPRLAPLIAPLVFSSLRTSVQAPPRLDPLLLPWFSPLSLSSSVFLSIS